MERTSPQKDLINNDFYESLNTHWYTAFDHPVALLRAENSVRNPWIVNEIKTRHGVSAKVLDVGCGAGFLANDLAKASFDVTGIDISNASLDVAKSYDETNNVKYIHASAYELPFQDASFDVVSAMDVLEHVEKPELLIKEAKRVLKPRGLFFFHTFDRNPLSYFVIIKGVEWFVKNTPKNMHVYDLFIKPKELENMLKKEGLVVEYTCGLVPCFWKAAFWKMLLTGVVPKDFGFAFVKSTKTGYLGYAKNG